MSRRETETRVAELSGADTALADLLQTLLSEVPDYVAPEVEAAAPRQVVEPVVVADETALNVPQARPIPPVEAVEEEAVSPRPGWAQGELKILVVRVGGLRLGVPLVRLSAILPAGEADAVTCLPAQPDWHRGVMPARGRQLVRVDPAALLGLKAEPEKPAYLLVLDSGRYALEVSAMEQPLSLPAGEIRWRAAGAGKDWALGMLPEQMCILLDADAIDARLAGAEGQAR